KHYQGSVVIVSHDKFFLNRMVNKIVELYQQQLHIYVGDYEYYEREKEIRVELQQKAYENQQDYIRQQERFVERFKAKASKAAAAQSVQKRLDKIERIENAEIERPNIKINFQIEKQPGKIICELKHISKNFGNIEVLKNTSIEIDRGDKIALIGANGKGKSTLLRIVAGTEKFEGHRNWGHNVEESFYAQHQLEALNLSNTILDEMKECGSKKNELELRSLMGCFLFSGDDTDKRIKVLSGGEKARVALAKVIVSKSNFLLLDEPTNHLDMHSVELLADALNKYEGSYLLVSHDRFFISKTANKIWEIVDHEIKEFKGTYLEWVEWKERMAKQKNAKEKREDESSKKQEASDKKQDTSDKKQDEVNSKQQDSFVKKGSNNSPTGVRGKELQKLQRQFQKIEEEIAVLNQQKVQIETELANPDSYKEANKFSQLEKNYSLVQDQLKTANTQYEQLFEKIMEMENN
ncbi:MAG TPA: ABC-F family ATP-binding cassette domain-containing protein, partial [Chitinophagaceae bacterium]|nr:ABC-F family ATP-binding cassette domain-containing protein [Chitinophagaceae bacterium]